MENKDLNLKLMSKILFKEMGFNTHYEIKLRTKSYINYLKVHDISDIDVFGYMFNADLSYFTIGSECKSGETGALDEFYKFLGIAIYYKLSKSYLIITKIHQNARQVAIDNNFVCLSEAEIRRMLLGLGVNVDKSLRIEFAKYNKFNNYISEYRIQNEKLIEYISLDYWNREHWKSIHNLIHLARNGGGQQKIFNDINIAAKYFHYYFLELFCFLILKNISEAIVLNYSDIENALINCLYGGAEALNEKRRIHDAVNIATQDNADFEPSWQTDFVTISSRMALSTKSSSVAPQMIQDIYENCFFATTNSIKIENKVIKKYPDVTRKFVQDIIQFLITHCNIPPLIFEDFMDL
jgi:hypothetical protein